MEMLGILSFFFYLGIFCLMPLVIVAIFVFILYLFRNEAKKQETIWKEVAAQANLTFIPGSFFKRPSVAGLWKERPLQLHIKTTGGGGHGGTAYTIISLEVENPAGITLTLGEESIFRQVAGLMLGEDTQIGVEAFDNRFHIQCRPPGVARTILFQNNLYERLMETHSLRITVIGKELRYQQVGIEMDKEYLFFAFDLLCDLAEEVEHA